MHIEDWLAGVQRSSRQKKPLKRQINQNNTFMRNKPNLCVFWAVSGDCEEKQTQTNPIQSQNKAIFRTKNRPQSQNKPNSNPIKPNSCGPRRSKPPAKLRNSARPKNIKTKSLKLDKQKLPQREKKVAKQKYLEKEMTLSKNTPREREKTRTQSSRIAK